MKKWFKHWLAFNKLSWKLGLWKFKYLFHDFDIILLSLIMMNKNKAVNCHESCSKHHIFNDFLDWDWEEMYLDWECEEPGNGFKMFKKTMLDYSGTYVANKLYDGMWRLVYLESEDIDWTEIYELEKYKYVVEEEDETTIDADI